MTSIKVALIGYGVVGKVRHTALKEFSDVIVDSVADSGFSEEYACDETSGVHHFRNYKTMLARREKLDAIFVSVPNFLSPEVVSYCLARGLHVFAEKPPARHWRELTPLIEQLTDGNLILGYGFNHRFHDSVMQAKKLIISGELGSPVGVRGLYGKSKLLTFGQTTWRTHLNFAGGGILIDQGIHMLDLIDFLIAPVEHISGYYSNSVWGYEVEDNAYVNGVTKTAVPFQICSSASQWAHTFRLEVGFTDGALALSGILSNSKSYGDETITITRSPRSCSLGFGEVETRSFSTDRSWHREMRLFFDSIKAGKQLEGLCSVVDAKRSLKAVNNFYENGDLLR